MVANMEDECQRNLTSDSQNTSMVAASKHKKEKFELKQCTVKLTVKALAKHS